MKNWRQWFASRSFACALWVALCFALTSGVYLTWLGRLVAIVGTGWADWASMVAGYLFQALGLFASGRWLRRPGANHRREAALVIALFAAVSVPSLLTDSPVALLGFGWLMNLLCGGLSGCYIHAIALSADANRRALAFGGGYAAAIVLVGLMALVGGGVLTRPAGALPVCMVLAALALWAALRLPLFEAGPEPPEAAKDMAEPDDRGVLMACAVVVLISAVKNLGFSFPSADIQAGLNPQLSRLPYAIGLLAAGIIADRSRKNAMICTLAALALPFIMLALVNEPVSSAVFWGLDYLFFGFFSVFRVALFVDIAIRARRPELSVLGLMMGRLGDVLGTAVALLLQNNQIALIAVSALAFVPAVFMLLRQFQNLYEPSVVQQKNEQEVFESFCLRSDLSYREREVLRMLLAGHSNASISEALFITENTVKYHVRNVLQKTGSKNRGELQKKFTLALYPHLESLTQSPAESAKPD